MDLRYNRFLYYPDNRKVWNITKDELEQLDKFLESPSHEVSKYTNWELTLYHWNYEYGNIEGTFPKKYSNKLEAFLDGYYDTKKNLSNICYVPSNLPLMKYYDIETPAECDLFCLSSVRGNDICVPHKMPFSFYFSQKEFTMEFNVKPLFNLDKIIPMEFGTLKMYDDWEYIPGPNDKDVSEEQINEMKNFFKKFKILFAGVWEVEIPENALSDYLRGYSNFQGLLKECYFYDDYKIEMDSIETIEEFEQFIRDNNIFNMWD